MGGDRISWKESSLFCKLCSIFLPLSIIIGAALVVSPYASYVAKCVALGWIALAGLVVLCILITSIILLDKT